MIVVVPAMRPETMPELVPTVATDILLLIHVPPPASLRAVVRPAHTLVVPVIADGKGFTVISEVIIQPVTGNL